MSFVPRANAFANYEWNDNDAFGFSANNYLFGLQLSWDIFSGYKNVGKIHYEKAQLEAENIHTRVISAIPMDQVCEPYIRRRAVRHLEKGRVCIFAAGTGNPYFTTDTAATLRASEMSCEIMYKGTQVDGIYDSDPKTNPDAKRYTEVTYDEVLQKNLKVMDAAAIALARDNRLPIVLFDLNAPEGLVGILSGQGNFTTVIPS